MSFRRWCSPQGAQPSSARVSRMLSCAPMRLVSALPSVKPASPALELMSPLPTHAVACRNGSFILSAPGRAFLLYFARSLRYVFVTLLLRILLYFSRCFSVVNKYIYISPKKLLVMITRSTMLRQTNMGQANDKDLYDDDQQPQINYDLLPAHEEKQSTSSRLSSEYPTRTQQRTRSRRRPGKQFLPS